MSEKTRAEIDSEKLKVLSQARKHIAAMDRRVLLSLSTWQEIRKKVRQTKRTIPGRNTTRTSSLQVRDGSSKR